MNKQEYEELLRTHKTTFKRLQAFVRRIDMYTEEYFDEETANEPTFNNKDPYERARENIGRNLVKLHLLKIPLHYDRNGFPYIVRQECEHILCSKEIEDALEKTNLAYMHFIQMKKSKKRDEAGEIYNQECAKLIQLCDIIMFDETQMQWKLIDEELWFREL